MTLANKSYSFFGPQMETLLGAIWCLCDTLIEMCKPDGLINHIDHLDGHLVKE